MAIYRQIQTTFWQDSFVLSLTPEEKYFYIYLFTNSKTKQCGIYELPLKIAEVETGYNRETLIKLLQRFIEFGKIAYDWENNELAIKNWLKYNPTTNPKIKACVEKELAFVKNKGLIDFIKYCEIEPKYPIHRVSQQEEEQEEEQEKQDTEFEKFWNMYDKKVGKPKTLSLWKKLKNSDKEAIFQHLPLYTQKEKIYRKDPERYISKRVWEDEVITNNIGEKKCTTITLNN